METRYTTLVRNLHSVKRTLTEVKMGTVGGSIGNNALTKRHWAAADAELKAV